LLTLIIMLVFTPYLAPGGRSLFVAVLSKL